MSKEEHKNTHSTKSKTMNGVRRKRPKNTSSQLSNKRMKIKEEKKKGALQNSKAFTEEAKNNLKTYTKLKTIYEEEGMTQKTHQFLTRITRAKVRMI